jgi:hypothetical protein
LWLIVIRICPAVARSLRDFTWKSEERLNELVTKPRPTQGVKQRGRFGIQ